MSRRCAMTAKWTLRAWTLSCAISSGRLNIIAASDLDRHRNQRRAALGFVPSLSREGGADVFRVPKHRESGEPRHNLLKQLKLLRLGVPSLTRHASDIAARSGETGDQTKPVRIRGHGQHNWNCLGCLRSRACSSSSRTNHQDICSLMQEFGPEPRDALLAGLGRTGVRRKHSSPAHNRARAVPDQSLPTRPLAGRFAWGSFQCSRCRSA
jgi:hypothetical protein